MGPPAKNSKLKDKEQRGSTGSTPIRLTPQTNGKVKKADTPRRQSSPEGVESPTSSVLEKILTRVDRIDEMMKDNLEMREKVGEIEGRVTENSERIDVNTASNEMLVKRMNSLQTVNLLMRKEQYKMKKHMLRMASSIPKIKEETLRDMKDAERESRILVITDYALNELRGFRGADEHTTLRNFAYYQLRNLNQRLTRSDVLYVKSMPSTKGRFRLLAELQTKQQAELVKQRGVELGLKIRLGESHLLRKIMRSMHKKCETLNNKQDGYSYEVRNGTQIFKIDEDGQEEELFTKTSAELVTPNNLNLESPLYTFVGDSDESDIDDDLEEERKILEDETYNPPNHDQLKEDRRKRRREEVEEVRVQLEEIDESQMQGMAGSGADPNAGSARPPSAKETFSSFSSQDDEAPPPRKRPKRSRRKDKGVGKRSTNHQAENSEKQTKSKVDTPPKRVSFKDDVHPEAEDMSSIDDEMDYVESSLKIDNGDSERDKRPEKLKNEEAKSYSKSHAKPSKSSNSSSEYTSSEGDSGNVEETDSSSVISYYSPRRKRAKVERSSHKQGDSHRPPERRRNEFGNGYNRDYRARSDRRNRNDRNFPSRTQPRFYSDSDETYDNPDLRGRYSRDENSYDRPREPRVDYYENPRNTRGGHTTSSRYRSRGRGRGSTKPDISKHNRTESEQKRSDDPQRRGGSRAGRMPRGAPRKPKDSTQKSRPGRGRGRSKKNEQPLDKMSVADIENYLKMKKEKDMLDQRMKALQTGPSTSADDHHGGGSSTNKGSK